MNAIQVFTILTFCVLHGVLGIPNLARLLQGLQGGGESMTGGGGPCPYQPHSNRFQFSQMDNNRLVIKDCAPGTMYDATACTCVMASAAAGASRSSVFGGMDVGLSSNLLNIGSMNDAGSEQSRLISLLRGLQQTGPALPMPVRSPVKPQSRARTNQMDILRNLMNTNAKSTNKLTPQPTPTLKPRKMIPGGVSINMLKRIQSRTKPKSKPKAKPMPKSKPTPSRVYRLVQKKSKSPSVAKPTRPAPKQSDPLAALLARIGGASSRSRARRPTKDPLAALLASLERQRPSPSPSPRPTTRRPMGGRRGGGGSSIASLLGGGGGGGGGMGDFMGLMGGGTGRRGGGRRGLDLTSLGGNLQAAAFLGETPGIGLAANMEITDYLNLQGALGVGGNGGLAGLRNINPFRLRQLERADILDLGDLTPQGIAAMGHLAG